MKLIFSYFGEFANEIVGKFKRSSVAAIKKEEEYTYRQLMQYVAVRNCKSVIAVSAIGIFTLLVFLSVRLAVGFSSDIAGDLTDIAAYLLLSLDFITALLLCHRELSKRQTDCGSLKLLYRLFWSVFAVGALLLTMSDIITGSCTKAYWLTYTALLIFADMTTVEVLLFGAGIHAPMLLAYALCGYSPDSIIAVFLSMVGFIVLSASIGSAIAEDWLGKRSLSTANERCKQMAEKDLFTGLLNKSGLTKKMKERAAHDSADSTYAVILADIDNFRKFGILYGDEQANSCLYNVCNCIRIISKAHTDIISRFGEDDFVIVLKNIGEYDMIALSEQLRDSVETMALPFGDKVVTVTLGVSSIGNIRNDNAFSVLLQEADNQLVIAKNGGKNCIGYKGRVFRNE